MRIATAVPPFSVHVRTYPGETTIAELERDAQLLADAGLSPIIVQTEQLALYREQTADEQLVAIAKENSPPAARRAALQREIDNALEPHDPTARRRDRSPFTDNLDVDAATERHLQELDGHRGIRVLESFVERGQAAQRAVDAIIPPAEAPHAFDAAQRVRE